MAKKKAAKKSIKSVSKVSKKSVAKKVVAKAVAKKSVAKKKAVAKKKVVSKKPVAKKVYKKKSGRKPTYANRYNTIKSSISSYYQSTIGRNVKRYEMKVIYQWIKENYGTQSVKYVIMNIDVIIDTFWKEYCNIYPVDLQNHARYFDWYYLKDYLSEEKEYHYPSDIISVDLSSIGEGVFEFFMEDYLKKCDEYYAICTQAGIRRYDYPMIYLKDAYCDISKKGNVYNYILYLDDDLPISTTTDIEKAAETTIEPASEVSVSTPISTPITIPTTETQKEAVSQTQITNEQLTLEIEKERLKQEFDLKKQKLKEFAELLKNKTINFQEYLQAIKSL